ncbi:MAG: PAS domain S-box protein [Chloroflexi bacterium]|nr:PAS domain S-box protein [Chloroflexota bacterium]
MTKPNVEYAPAPDELQAAAAGAARRGWFNATSRRAQMAAALAAFALYALAFFATYPLLGSAATSLSALPVIVAGWLLGLWPGFLFGVLCFVINLVLLNVAGEPGWEILFHSAGGVMGTALLPVLGAAAGRVGDLVRQAERELSGRQHAEDQIRRMALLLDTAPNSITVHDLDGRFLFANQRALDLHGYERDEFMALNLHQLDVPASEKLFGPRTQALLERGEATFEVDHFRKDGSVLPLEISARVTTWGGAKAILNVATDISERKRAESALKAHEQHLLSIYDTVGDVIFQLAVEGEDRYRFSDVNRAFLAVTGLTAAQVIGQPLDAVIPQPSLGMVLEKYAAAIREKNVVRWEETSAYPTGTLVGDVSIAPLFDEAGQCNYLVGAVHDITERKRAEQALKDSERKYRSLVDVARDIVFSVETDGRISSVNPAFEALTQWPPAEWVGQPFASLIHPDDLPRVAEYFRRGMAGETPPVFETRIRTQAGPYLDLELSTAPHWEHGTIVGAIGIARDLTARKRTEAALSESRAQLAGIIATAMDAIITVDVDQRIVGFNAAAEKMFGHPAAAALGQPLALLVPQGFRAAHAGQFDGFVNDGITMRAMNELPTLAGVRANGEEFPVEISISGVEIAGRKLYTAIARDITERQRVEAALRASEERYRLLVETLPDGVIVHSQGRVVFANPSSAALIGAASPAELAGKPVMEFVHPDYRALVLKRIQQSLSDGVPLPTMEEKFVRLDGTPIDVEVSAMPFAYAGKPAMLTVFNDITGRKRAEQALAASEAELRALFASMRDVVLVIDREGIYRKIGPTAPAVWYIPPHELLGKRLHDVFPSEQADVFRTVVQQVLDTKQTTQIEYELSGNPGVWFESSIAPMDEEQTLWVARDITARRQSEEQMRHRMAELEALHTVSAALRSAETIDEALPILLDEMLAALETDAGAIWLYHGDSGELRVSVERGWFAPLGKTPMKPGEGIAGTVFASGQAHLSADFLNDPLSRATTHEQVPAGWGGVCLPIRTGATSVGVLFVSKPAAHPLTAEQVKLLESLAEMAGAALHRMRLHEETVQQVAQLKALHTVSVALRMAQTSDDALTILFDETLAVLDTDAGAIWLYHADSGYLRPAINRGWFQELVTMPLKPGEGIAGAIFASGQTYSTADFRSDPRARADNYERIPPVRSVAGLPLRSGSEAVGVLFIALPPQRSFTAEQLALLESLAEMSGAALHRMRLHEETVRHLNQLQALHDIDLAIKASMDLRITLDILLGHVTSQLQVDCAAVLLLDPYAQTLAYASGRGFRTYYAQAARIRVGEDFAGRAVQERRMMHVTDVIATAANAHFVTLWQQEGLAAYYGVPLIAKGQVKGVLEVFHRTPLAPDPLWLEFLETLAGQAAIAIDNAQLFDNLQRSNLDLSLAYDATIEGWSRALDLRDKETEGHTQRVTALALRLARSMGLGDSELMHMQRGALLHDIGKMGVPDSILLKPGALSEREWQVMRKHPDYAREMLAPIAYLRPAIDIPYCHHEKWDGTGYPRGLKGEQIPLTARIFAVVDVWDALRSDRPYRSGWPDAETLAYVRAEAGTHFDPRVVQTFLALMAQSDDGADLNAP